MKLRSYLLTVFGWWIAGAAALGAFYPWVLISSDEFFQSGISAAISTNRVAATAAGAVAGVGYGLVVALINTSIGVLQRRRPESMLRMTRLVSIVGLAVVLRSIVPTADTTIEQVTIVGAMALATLFLSVIIADRAAKLGDEEETDETEVEFEEIQFEPTHVVTTEATSDTVESFVRNSLRVHGSGNALFTVQAESAPSSAHNPATQVLVDPGGTGHALSLAAEEGGDSALADDASALPGFTLTDDRTIAIAPPGLSAAAVVSEGISMVQRVSGQSEIAVRFDGFGF